MFIPKEKAYISGQNVFLTSQYSDLSELKQQTEFNFHFSLNISVSGKLDFSFEGIVEAICKILKARSNFQIFNRAVAGIFSGICIIYINWNNFQIQFISVLKKIGNSDNIK